MLTGSKGFGERLGEGPKKKKKKGSGYQNARTASASCKGLHDRGGRTALSCFADFIPEGNARRDRIELTLHERAWGGRRKSCSFDMRVPFGCCSRLHLTNPSGSKTIYRSDCFFHMQDETSIAEGRPSLCGMAFQRSG